MDVFCRHTTIATRTPRSVRAGGSVRLDGKATRGRRSTNGAGIQAHPGLESERVCNLRSDNNRQATVTPIQDAYPPYLGGGLGCVSASRVHITALTAGALPEASERPASADLS